MIRAAAGAIAVACAASTAHADSATKPRKPLPPFKPGPPDEIADTESREANLESNAPRAGLTFAASIGPGLIVGSSIGRGPVISLRTGHVATRRTVITFELTIFSLLHRPAMNSPVQTDTSGGVLAGAQRYVSSSTWVRLSGGLAGYTANVNTDTQHGGAGLGVLAGGGVDLVRWGYLVLGLEAIGMLSRTSEGTKFQTALNLGLSYY